jgi:Family of unknown function (DUF5706)
MPTQSDNQDAYFAISQFTSWISSADTKAGFLSAALAVVAGSVISESSAHFTGTARSGPRAWCASTLLGLAMAATFVCALYLLLTVYPRVREQRSSRYSWPSVAAQTERALVESNYRTDREEAWATAKSLALIAQDKFRYLRRAFWAWLFVIGSLLLSAAIRS